MKTPTNVRLSINGDYWTATFRDRHGRRQRRGLGPRQGTPAARRCRKPALTRRQAVEACLALAVELHLNPTRASRQTAPTLEHFLDLYLSNRRGELGPHSIRAQRATMRYLLAHFGADAPIDTIDRPGAKAWEAALAAGEIPGMTDGERPSQATVAHHVRNAKGMFSHAVQLDMLAANPFDRLSSTPRQQDRPAHVVMPDAFDRIMSACPNAAWRVFLGLQRMAGLRLSEALAAKWSDVDWARRRLVVFATKTGRRREVPLADSLYRQLVDLFHHAAPGDTLIVSAREVSRTSQSALRGRFGRIIAAAGLAPWEKVFQALRRSCEEDWKRAGFAEPTYSRWMGHSPAVSRLHYVQPQDDEFARAAGLAQTPATV